MATPILKPNLPTFGGAAAPRHDLNAGDLLWLPGTDNTHYLVAPGVLGCAVLTIFYRPVLIGAHRLAVPRAMVHYNKFMTNQLNQTAITALFGQFLALGVAPNQLAVSILFHDGTYSPNKGPLLNLVSQAVPTLQFVNYQGYGIGATTGHSTTPVTMYMAPNGALAASQ